MLSLYNAVANNGKFMRPYLVNEIKDFGVTVKKIEPQVLDAKICSDATIKKLKECMLEVVEGEHGTAHKVVFDSTYKIAGKTGTAVTAQDNKGYNKGAKVYQASFIGYFPANAPKYSMAVVIQNTRESKLIYGADVSGAVFKEISDKIYARYLTTASYTASLQKDTLINNAIGMKHDVHAIFSYMNIPFSDASVSGSWRNIMITQNEASLNNIIPTVKNIIPDVVGMGLKDAVYLLENKGLKLILQGKGKVINQSLMAGTNFTKGQKMVLYLN
jgi:cell division protein FtsI (penicillin-binding protein 3)